MRVHHSFRTRSREWLKLGFASLEMKFSRVRKTKGAMLRPREAENLEQKDIGLGSYAIYCFVR